MCSEKNEMTIVLESVLKFDRVKVNPDRIIGVSKGTFSYLGPETEREYLANGYFLEEETTYGEVRHIFVSYSADMYIPAEKLQMDEEWRVEAIPLNNWRWEAFE